MYEYKTLNPDTWIEDRRKGLGASDMAVLAGYGKKYTRVVDGRKVQLTPHVLWLEKTGRIDGFQGNERTYWGNLLEEVVADEFIRKAGFSDYNTIKKSEYRHPSYKWAYSHPDLVYFIERLTRETRSYGLQEIKTGRYFGTMRRGDPDYGYDPEDFSASGIPASVYCQVIWQMFTSGIYNGGVSVLIDTSDYREYGPIVYDKKVGEGLLALGDKFWWYVEKDKEPPPETFSDVCMRFPDIQDTGAVVAGEPMEKVLAMKARKKEVKGEIKKLEAEIRDMEAAMALLIGENKVLSGPDGEKLASQSVYNRKSFSIKELEKHPGLYDTCKAMINTTEVRRLYW